MLVSHPRSWLPAALGVAIVAAAVAALPHVVHQQSADGPVAGAEHQSFITRSDPAWDALPPSRHLDRAQWLPPTQGMVRGTTGQPTMRQLPRIGLERYGEIVTDYPLRITEVHLRDAAPYRPGQTITLRVAGGTLGGLTMHAEGAPVVEPGQDVFVVVRDQGTQLGGNTATVLVPSTPADLFPVREGVVQEDGLAPGTTEPLATFERHFGD